MVATLKGPAQNKALLPFADTDANLSGNKAPLREAPSQESFDSILGNLLDKVQRASPRTKNEPDGFANTTSRRQREDLGDDERPQSRTQRKKPQGDTGETMAPSPEGIAFMTSTPQLWSSNSASVKATTSPAGEAMPSQPKQTQNAASREKAAVTPVAATAEPSGTERGAQRYASKDETHANARSSVDEATLALLMAAQAQGHTPGLLTLQGNGASAQANNAALTKTQPTPLNSAPGMSPDLNQELFSGMTPAMASGLTASELTGLLAQAQEDAAGLGLNGLRGNAMPATAASSNAANNTPLLANASQAQSLQDWALGAPRFDSVQAEFTGFDIPVALQNNRVTDATPDTLKASATLPFAALTRQQSWQEPLVQLPSSSPLGTPGQAENQDFLPTLGVGILNAEARNAQTAGSPTVTLSGAALLSAEQESARSRDLTGRIFLPQRDMTALKADLAQLKAEVAQLISDEEILTDERFARFADARPASAFSENSAIGAFDSSQGSDLGFEKGYERSSAQNFTQNFGQSFGEQREGRGQHDQGSQFQNSLGALGTRDSLATDKRQDASSFGLPLAARLNDSGLETKGDGRGIRGSDPALVRNISKAALSRIEDRALELQARGGGLAKVQIRDSKLGEVELRINMNGQGRIQVEMTAADAEVRKELEKGIDELRANLERNNLSVSDVKVVAEAQKTSSESNNSEQKNSQQHTANQNAFQQGQGNDRRSGGDQPGEWAMANGTTATRDASGKKLPALDNPAPSLRQRIVQRGENGSLKVFA